MDLHKKEISISSDHLEAPAPIYCFSTDEEQQYELMDKATIESRMEALDAKIDELSNSTGSGDSNNGSNNSSGSSSVLKPWLYDVNGEEVIIGVYGGKPLYRKAIELIVNCSADMAATYTLSDYIDVDFDKVVKIQCHNIDDNLILPYISTGSNSAYDRCVTVSPEENLIYFICGTSATIDNKKHILFLEYTKATDAEGSGSGLTPGGSGGSYELPKADRDTLGGVTIGSGINVNDGEISINYPSHIGKIYGGDFYGYVSPSEIICTVENIPKGKYLIITAANAGGYISWMGINGTVILDTSNPYYFKSDSGIKFVEFAENVNVNFFNENGQNVEYAPFNVQIIQITDGVCYSLDEMVVGTWIDGKPLYQKTIIEDIGENLFSTITSPADNIDVIVDIKSILRITATNGTYNYRKIPSAAIDNATIVEQNVTASSIYTNLGSTFSNFTEKRLYITIQYTKTTD